MKASASKTTWSVSVHRSGWSGRPRPAGGRRVLVGLLFFAGIVLLVIGRLQVGSRTDPNLAGLVTMGLAVVLVVAGAVVARRGTRRLADASELGRGDEPALRPPSRTAGSASAASAPRTDAPTERPGPSGPTFAELWTEEPDDPPADDRLSGR